MVALACGFFGFGGSSGRRGFGGSFGFGGWRGRRRGRRTKFAAALAVLKGRFDVLESAFDGGFDGVGEEFEDHGVIVVS